MQSDYSYKLEQLHKMLDYEQFVPENKRFGVHLQHWAVGKPINIDAGAIKALISYYNQKERKELLAQLDIRT